MLGEVNQFKFEFLFPYERIQNHSNTNLQGVVLGWTHTECTQKMHLTPVKQTIWIQGEVSFSKWINAYIYLMSPMTDILLHVTLLDC